MLTAREAHHQRLADLAAKSKKLTPGMSSPATSPNLTAIAAESHRRRMAEIADRLRAAADAEAKAKAEAEAQLKGDAEIEAFAREEEAAEKELAEKEAAAQAAQALVSPAK